MSVKSCPECGGAMERGFVSTTNGSGLFWSHDAASSRLRPKGLQVLVPTGFGGMYSANIAGERCGQCGMVELHPKDVPK